MTDLTDTDTKRSQQSTVVVVVAAAAAPGRLTHVSRWPHGRMDVTVAFSEFVASGRMMPRLPACLDGCFGVFRPKEKFLHAS